MRKTDATELSKGLMRHRLLGGTAIAAKMDTLLYLHQVSDADPRRLILAETRKGKNIEATYLTFNSETQHAELGHTLAEDKAADKIKLSTNAKLAKKSDITWYVHNQQGQPKTTVATEVGGKREVTLALLDELISEGKLIGVPAEKNATLIYTSDYPFCYCGKPVSLDFAKEGTCSAECWNAKDKTCAWHLCDKPVLDVYARDWTSRYCHSWHRESDEKKKRREEAPAQTDQQAQTEMKTEVAV